jgi:hypothetical protein
MSAVKRPVVAFVALLGLLLGGLLALATAASATPYVPGATCSVTDGTPAVGGSVTVNASDFGADDDIQFTLHTVTYPLGSATSDGAGSVSITADLPDGVAGHHTIQAFDPTTNQLCSVDVNIGGSGTGGQHNGGGPTATTGVAVFALGGLAVLLLIGGGLLLLAGRRRKASV